MKIDWAAASRNRLLQVLVALVLLGGVAAFAVSEHRWAQARLAEVEPRHARLLGLQASAASLEAALVERRAALARHAYLSSQDIARAGSDAQQRSREVFAKAGLEVSSTQVLPAKAVAGYDRIPVVLRLEGEMAALHNALALLPAQSPSLFLEGFNVQTVGVPRADAAPRLNIQANLFVLRVRP